MKCHRESMLVKMDTVEGIEKKDLELRTDCDISNIAETTMGTPIIA